MIPPTQEACRLNITAIEDIAGNVDLSLINLADVDSATDDLTVILTTGAGGTLAAADGGGVTVGGSGSGVLTLTGNQTDLNAFLDVASNIQFTSFLNANGSDADTIQVAVNDNGNTGSGGGTDINLGTVNVDISPVNDDPTNAGVLPTDITVTEDVASNVDLSPINVLDVDSASGNLAITLTTGSGGTLEATTAGGVTVGGSGSGVLTLTGNQTDLNTFLDDVTSIQFTGILNANGDNADSIQINVTDNGNTGLGGGGTVNFGTINVDIDPVNDPPSVAAVDLGSIDEETPLLITQAALLSGSSDVDGDSLTGLNLTLTVGSGLVEDNLDGTFTFTPALNFNGPVSFSFDVNDGTVSTPNTASLTVNNLDDPPVPMDDSGALFTTNEDTSFRINASAVLANDEDPDLGPTTPEVLSIVSVSSSSEQGATVTYDPGTNRITYDPTTSDALQALAPGEALADSFTYSIRDLDGELNPPTATVFLTITGVNDAPTVVDDVVPAPTTLDPVVITPLVNDFDVDGTLDLDTLIITEDPQFGSLAKRINSFGVLELAYSPFSNFPGSDVFRYTISDNLGQQSAQATVTIQSSRAPQTGADIAGGVTGDDININVLANDVAVEGNLDTSIPTIFGSGPANGQAIPQADGTITYVANPGYLGPDSFQYTVADSAGNVSAPTLVTVRVVASGLENPLRFGDVNANGEVTSLDALIVINRIALSGGQTSIPVLPDDRGPMYYDVNGNLEITTLDALLVINHIGEDAPIISAEFVEQPIIADLSSSVDNDTEWESIDTALDAPGIDSSVQQKLVGAAADALVDRDVIDLLAEAQEASVESEEPASLNDLAILDLLP